MDEKTAKKLNDDFDEFCQKIGSRSALAYFAIDDNVALALHSVSDAEILNVVANLVHHLASKITLEVLMFGNNCSKVRRNLYPIPI